MRRLSIVIAGMAALAAMPTAVAKSQSLDQWLLRDLVPYVREQLTTLPRFKNESVRFVIMRDESPQAEGSALALATRDRLRDALTDTPGIRIAWRADQPGVGLVSAAGDIDCNSGNANYFIGLEFEQLSRGELAFYLVSDAGNGPYRCKIRGPAFVNIAVLPEISRGYLIADLVAIIGSLDIVLGEVDR